MRRLPPARRTRAPGRTSGPDALIRLHGVAKTYWLGATPVRALRGVSLTIREGEFVAIMGPSGSGKSTLMHLLGLLDVPDAGSYKLLGHEAAGLDDDALAALRGRTVGFVFQQFNLLPRLSARDNIELPLLYGGGATRAASRGRTEALARAFALSNRLTHRPGELSGGQQQRVAIARSLVNAPSLILADEPTGNLDSHTKREILDLLTRLNRAGLTIILVTHEEEVAAYARRVIWMRDGRVLWDRRQRGLAVGRAAAGTGALVGPVPAVRAGATRSAARGLGAPLARWRTALTPLAVHARGHLAEAMTSLAANKARAALSTLGITIGVAAVIAMLAIGTGAKESLSAMMSKFGTNVLSVRAEWYQPHGRGSDGVITRLTTADAAALVRAHPGIVCTAPMVWSGGSLTYRGKDWSPDMAIGCTPPYAEVRAWHPVAGRFFTEAEDRSRARVLLLGASVIRQLYADGENPVGTTVRLNRVPFTVIGLLPEKGGGGRWDPDNIMLVPLGTAMYRMSGKRFVDQIDVQFAAGADVDELMDAIKAFLSRRYRLKGGKDDAFSVRNEMQWRQALSSMSDTMSALLAVVAVISLMVGGIGIMNIMLVTVTERTREIGLRKAVGARGSDVLVQFLSEAAAISVTGGVIGILLGGAVAFGMAKILQWTVVVTPFSILLSFGFSAGVGILFGFWPARRAAALAPAEALRSE